MARREGGKVRLLRFSLEVQDKDLGTEEQCELGVRTKERELGRQ